MKIDGTLPTRDELELCSEKFALAYSDLDAISAKIHLATLADEPPAISRGTVGSVWLFARECESQAEGIRTEVGKLLRDLHSLYRGNVALDHELDARNEELVAAWHREAASHA